MKAYLRKIDTETTGNRNDVTPVFLDPELFSQLVEDLSEPFQNKQIDYVGCIDALGFILGTAVARHLDVGVIPIRKGGKLPVETIGRDFQDYSGKTKRLEIRKDLLLNQSRVLLVDEWIETGAQIEAAISLIEAQGGTIAGIATINMDVCDRTQAIRKKYQVHTVWED